MNALYKRGYHLDGQYSFSESEEEAEDESDSSKSDSSEEEVEDEIEEMDTPVPFNPIEMEPDEELNSDDDLPEDPKIQQAESVSTACRNVIYCQWEKVGRQDKSRWSVKLKDGIMHIDGKDYVFSKCHGNELYF